MLIFEGSDCLGKTTAIMKTRKLLKDQNPPLMYCHMGRPNEELFDFRVGYLEHIHRNVIQDRFHLGGIVWHKDKITRDGLFFVENQLVKVGAVVVVFTASDEEWYKKKLETDQRGNLLSMELMLEANHQFCEMAVGSHPLNPHVDFYFDVSSENYPNESHLAEFVETWKKRLPI